MHDSEKAYPIRNIGDETDINPNTSIAKIFRMIRAGSRVLDVGCASGDLAQLLQARGSDVVGIDINPEAAATAAAFCSRTLVADLDVERLPDLLPGERFDAIVFADVLEHLRDPWSTLDSVRGMLNENGLAIISVPNIGHGAIRLGLLFGSFDYRQYGILDDTHIRFFTRRSVEILLIRAGFRLEHIERTTLPLFQPSELVGVIDPARVSADVLTQIRADDDHETLQFIVSARALDDLGKMEQLSRSYAFASTAEAEVAEARRQLLVTQAYVADMQAEVSAVRLARNAEAEIALTLAAQQLTTLYDAYRESAETTSAALRASASAEAVASSARKRAIDALHALFSHLSSRVDDYGRISSLV